MIYIKKDGSKVLSINDDEYALLEWDERILLELEHDGTVWTIQQSNCMTGKVIAE